MTAAPSDVGLYEPFVSHDETVRAFAERVDGGDVEKTCERFLTLGDEGLVVARLRTIGRQVAPETVGEWVDLTVGQLLAVFFYIPSCPLDSKMPIGTFPVRPIGFTVGKAIVASSQRPS